MRKNGIYRVVVVAALGWLWANNASAEGQQLLISYPAANAIHWDLSVAIDQGFFRDEGFAPAITTFQSSPQSIQLIVSRSAQVATIQPESLIAAGVRGPVDVGAIAQQQWRPEWKLVARSDIKSWSDLKGKTLGFSALRVAEFWLTGRLLAAHGLGANDWSGIQVGPSPLKLAALEKGSIAAAVLFEPSAESGIKTGSLHSLADFSALGNYPATLIAVGRSWAAENHNGQRAARAIRRAHRWLYDPANREAAVKVLMTHSKCDHDVAERVYESYFIKDKIYTPDGAIDRPGLARAIKLMADVGALPSGAKPKPVDFLIPQKDGGIWR